MPAKGATIVEMVVVIMLLGVVVYSVQLLLRLNASVVQSLAIASGVVLAIVIGAPLAAFLWRRLLH